MKKTIEKEISSLAVEASEAIADTAWTLSYLFDDYMEQLDKYTENILEVLRREHDIIYPKVNQSDIALSYVKQ